MILDTISAIIIMLTVYLQLFLIYLIYEANDSKILSVHHWKCGFHQINMINLLYFIKLSVIFKYSESKMRKSIMSANISEIKKQILKGDYIFITDIGSTTTKGLLLKKNGRTFKFYRQADTSTTVEKPHEDVNVGIQCVVEQLEISSGIKIFENGQFLVPYITTSSAAGGLQIMVVGLTKTDTAKNAELTALGAGGVILRTFAINDGLRDIEKINIINNLDPDMVLMAGGYDNKDSYFNIFSITNILALSDIKSRFQAEEKIPLLYCGNSFAKEYIKTYLKSNLDIYVTENIRPNENIYNFNPAKKKINDIFKNDVMKRAPGFKTLSERTYDQVAVTPTAVERMITVYSEKNNDQNIMVVDMGGATTDIYSYIHGNYHRTVAANIGLSFSLGNIFATILENKSIEYIMGYVPNGIKKQMLKNYIYNKTVNPSYIPLTKAEKLIEKVIAAIGINLAIEQHFDTNFDNIQSGFWTEKEKLSKRIKNYFNQLKQTRFKERGYSFYDKTVFYYSEVDQIIGSGGAISFADSKIEQIQLLIEGFMPNGVTKISVDSPFKISHMGLFSYFDEENALKLFEEDCLVDLAIVVAPTGKIVADKNVLVYEDIKTDEKVYLKGGTVTYLEQGGNLNITSVSNVQIDRNKSYAHINTNLPIVFDLRGREKYFNNMPLEISDCVVFNSKLSKVESKILKANNTSNKDYFEFERKLPHSGKIIVSKGDDVNSDDIFAYTKCRLPKSSFIDLKRFFIDTDSFSSIDLSRGLVVKEGDKIKDNDVIFNGYGLKDIVIDKVNMKTKTIKEKRAYKSPIDGIVEYIDFENGMMKIAEDISIDNSNSKSSKKPEKHVIVNVGEKLNIPPKKVENYIEKRIGDFIQKGSMIAKIVSFGIMKNSFEIVRSPIAGFLSEIDKEKGTITITREEIKEIPYRSLYNGKVISVNEKSIVISAKGTKISGIMGYGGESYGTLIEFNNKQNKSEKDVVYFSTKQLSIDVLKNLLSLELKGLIIPSINAEDISEIIGKEIGVAITGDEELAFPIIILHGFGEISMNSDIENIFREFIGKEISLCGRTHVRAGILRPYIMLND